MSQTKTIFCWLETNKNLITKIRWKRYIFVKGFRLKIFNKIAKKKKTISYRCVQNISEIPGSLWFQQFFQTMKTMLPTSALAEISVHLDPVAAAAHPSCDKKNCLHLYNLSEYNLIINWQFLKWNFFNVLENNLQSNQNDFCNHVVRRNIDRGERGVGNQSRAYTAVHLNMHIIVFPSQQRMSETMLLVSNVVVIEIPCPYSPPACLPDNSRLVKGPSAPSKPHLPFFFSSFSTSFPPFSLPI